MHAGRLDLLPPHCGPVTNAQQRGMIGDVNTCALAWGSKVSDETTKRYPTDWPDSCPLPDAKGASETVYRIAKQNPPTGDDFKTNWELGKYPKADPCLRAGLSVLKTLEDARHQIELFPKLGKHIAVGTLTPEHGMSRMTKGSVPSHTTWWPYDGVERCEVFCWVEEMP